MYGARFNGVFPALAALGVVLVLTLSGCGGGGGGGTSGLREEALEIHENTASNIDGAERQNSSDMVRAAHSRAASSLNAAIEYHTGADEGLQEVLTDIRDGHRRMADGEVSGSDADALMEEHAEYWSVIEDGELPPDYQ